MLGGVGTKALTSSVHTYLMGKVGIVSDFTDVHVVVGVTTARRACERCDFLQKAWFHVSSGVVASHAVSI